LKVVSPDITHKSDVGGVFLGVDSDPTLRDAYRVLLDRVTQHAPEAHIEGVSVQRMISDIDYEVILGAKKDNDFGTVILFGTGGTGAEVFKDFAIALPPLNQTLAVRLMEETMVYKTLQGYRNKPAADMRQLQRILVSFSNLVADFPEIAEMDINPLAITNGMACAADARIVLDPQLLDSTPQRPHLVITPYPTRYIMPWRLKDGTEVILRPIKPEDEPLEEEMLNMLSEETLRTRFFSPIKTTHQLLVKFCNIDYDREMAIVAEMRGMLKREIIGIGRLIVEADDRSAEFAVLVRDHYQGQGLGYKLVDTIIGIAQDKGLEEIHGTVLARNRNMIRVAQKLGFSTELLPDNLVKISLPL
jgi:acetyltransferase